MNKRSWAWTGVAGAITAGLVVMGWLEFAPIRAVQTQVRAKLPDPASATFSGVTFNRQKNAGCGFVNGRHFILFPSGELRFMPGMADPDWRADAEGSARKIKSYRQLIEIFCNPNWL